MEINISIFMRVLDGNVTACAHRASVFKSYAQTILYKRRIFLFSFFLLPSFFFQGSNRAYIYIQEV